MNLRQGEKAGVRARDIFPLTMDWTEELKAEMQERHLRQVKMYLIVITAMLPWVALFYYFIWLKLGFSNGGIYNYFFILILLYLYLFNFTFYFLLKKSPWIRATSWMLLLMDLINVTLFTYFGGAPHLLICFAYPVLIMLYSIYIHPCLATRFWILAMVLLGCVILLILLDIIPFMPAGMMDTEIYPFLRDYIIKPENHLMTYGAYSMLAAFTFAVLLVTIFTVMKIRQHEEELSISNERISRLSEKLKVYLPHQFVESLAHGDRETEPDYRRRRLTIFFSDVHGFTKWTDKLEPEEVRELLNQYLSEMSRIAHKWGGTIDKFIGDSILIFFGDPDFTNDRDHAIRCAKMAMEMQKKMASLRKEWEDIGYQEPLHIRIGINTGYATVGNFGSEERLNYTALGSSVNLASRLEEICAPDKITVSHTTYSLIKDEIDCVPKEDVEVKGFSEPVKIYEVKEIKQD